MKWYDTKEGLRGLYWGTVISVTCLVSFVAILKLTPLIFH